MNSPLVPNTDTDRPRIVLILGDQLSPDMHALKKADPEKDIVLMAEVLEEATYVPHHKKKIAFIFSAMRHFADELEAAGWRVCYSRLKDPENTGTLGGEVKRAVKQHNARGVLVTEPGEYRLKLEIQTWNEEIVVDVQCLEDTRFLASHAEFQHWANGRKQLRMEFFYRNMRRKTGFLMQGDQPEGGKWNFDQENRKPAQADLFMPSLYVDMPDVMTKGVLALVQEEFPDNFGELHPFRWAVTRAGARTALAHFVEHALPNFGNFQDAMLSGEPFLYHSVLSLYLNSGLLDPLEVCRCVERAYYEGHAPLNAAEGFIRQIIGWREYVRGVYWLKMPGYTEENYFCASRDLPDFYWTGKTDMACMAATIGQTRDEAYAHHIQRLMVTGNFAMLVGVAPKAVHEWYLAVYFDAFEWVEAPNVIGMSQFADGGLLGSKPYAASGNYINKMSDYCSACHYDVKQKTGDGACPFNALYWDFLIRNEGKFRANPRMGQVYRSWDAMTDSKKAAYRATAAKILQAL